MIYFLPKVHKNKEAALRIFLVDPTWPLSHPLLTFGINIKQY
jgi:hypothetical protein